MTPVEVSVGIAVASLVVVPAIVAIGRRLVAHWREAQKARLAREFMPREELELTLDKLAQTQARQHAENTQMLDTIRTEALKREGRIVEGMRNLEKHARQDITSVHARVDKIFELLSGRG